MDNDRTTINSSSHHPELMKLGMPQMWDDGWSIYDSHGQWASQWVNGHWNLPLANNSWALMVNFGEELNPQNSVDWLKHPETMELPLDPIRRDFGFFQTLGDEDESTWKIRDLPEIGDL